MISLPLAGLVAFVFVTGGQSNPTTTKLSVVAAENFYGDIANGTDPHKGGRENSVRQLINRVTRTIADWGIKDG